MPPYLPVAPFLTLSTKLPAAINTTSILPLTAAPGASSVEISPLKSCIPRALSHMPVPASGSWESSLLGFSRAPTLEMALSGC
uniref:Uncharacterized protein n=1 Tax=Vitis vinifera TaxID=29760 RepID=F6HEM5_VITVI